MSSFNPKKRRREKVNVDIKLVEIYDDLGNENDEIRLKAASELLSRFTPEANPAPEDVEKALLRLFRGLCSSRKAARLGFSIALTELLCMLFGPTGGERKNGLAGWDVSKAIDLLESNTNTTNAESGQEERDRHFGRLFGAEAILKSYSLFQPGVPFEHWTRLLSLVFELANKKPWLREECGYIIFIAIRDIGARNRDTKYIDSALAALCENNLAKTPEGIAIWLAAMDLSCSPAVAFPSGVWSHDHPLNSREKASLAKIMKESSGQDASNGEEAKVKSSGVWNPKLPFAWDPILTKLYSTPVEKAQNESKGKKEKSAQLSFIDFWTEVVDCGLFAAASSEERKYWGFLVFMKVLKEGSVEVASQIFTQNFMRCMMNQLAVEDRYLHKIAVKAAKSIQTRASKEPDFAYPALCGLMGPRGAVNFDQIAKVKVVEKIVTDVSHTAIKKLVPFFEGLIVNPEADDKAAASRRQLIANFLQTIVKSVMTSAKENDSDELDAAVEVIILTLAKYTYFSGEAAKPTISGTTRELFRNKIMASLNIVISSQKRSADIVYKIVQKIRDMEENGESGKSIIDMSESITESVHSAFKTLKKINKKSKQDDGEQDQTAQGLKLLYSLTILQVYNGDADAVSMLDELKMCYDKFLSYKKANDEESAQASDALVEILLSFASKPSHLFRKMSEQVFGAFADKLTHAGLESLLAVIDAKESLAGQQELFDKDDDEDEGEDDDDEEIDSDVEMIDGSDVEVVDAASESESDDEDEEEEEEEDGENEKNLAEFDAKLAAALGTHRADKDLEASDGSDDGSDMGDDDMEALDAQLVKVFQAREQASNKKKDKKDAKETMINFKNRVLDLLDIYVKKCHSNPLALEIIIPLLRLLRKSSVQQLVQKAANVLREYTRLCKGSAVPEVESAEPIWKMLGQVHYEAMRSASGPHGASCSQASLLLVKVLVAHDKESISGIVDVYADTRKQQLLSNKCHVQPSFFSDWNSWCVSASKQLKN
ncbi:DNA polymerase V [Nannizzia gypsea CBS 118893]|uniref:DNA polymerase V n=1 Tax=Arthroderma gypseum (strain ATCC MYA-4604 / CBS 118893) TaxID=535722 RepID=E4V6Y3_ARTGP|nr:DNA polymerase V [Nannizzia gypsea CBS 118893]EFQ96849.1 DNA polymerase V [Nannizzia gypsea CBS 118893]